MERSGADGAFVLHLPPEAVEVPLPPLDSEVGRFTAEGWALSYDFGLYSGLPADIGAAPRDERVGGRTARLAEAASESGTDVYVHFPVRPQDGSEPELALHGRCASEAACEVVRTAIRSVRFRRGG